MQRTDALEFEWRTARDEEGSKGSTLASRFIIHSYVCSWSRLTSKLWLNDLLVRERGGRGKERGTLCEQREMVKLFQNESQSCKLRKATVPSSVRVSARRGGEGGRLFVRSLIEEGASNHNAK